jgi:hypothetical protein
VPEENKNKYSKFEMSKLMSYQGQHKQKILSENTRVKKINRIIHRELKLDGAIGHFAEPL